MLMKGTKNFLKKKKGKGIKYYPEHRKSIPEDKKQKIAKHRKCYYTTHKK